MITKITDPLAGLLYQLQQLLTRLTDEQYCCPVPLLSQASIGQHTRHIIEFFLELEKGYETGSVNYDARERDHDIGSQRRCAEEKLLSIATQLEKKNKSLILIADFGTVADSPCSVPSNYYRELAYNLEHVVHHMALLRIAVDTVSTLELPDGFGVASSTLKHRKLCVQ